MLWTVEAREGGGTEMRKWGDQRMRVGGVNIKTQFEFSSVESTWQRKKMWPQTKESTNTELYKYMEPVNDWQ